MTQGNMGTAETPTTPRFRTRGSCSIVEPTQYSSQYELLVNGDPPRIVAVGRVLEGGQTIHGFTRPQKQPIHDTIIHEDDDMAEAEDDPLSKLMTRLPRIKKAPLELYWDLRVFGLPPLCQYLSHSVMHWRYMDTIVVDQGWSSMYGFVEPQTIQPSGNTLENRQHYW
ncbi:hypothetical protein LR48_Vigan05g064500 [Vigna angularis]|uniref:Uncharacterized protein n=1 Tax=Phaseolus angularis TaxID=3914 RepID=A0A0L9UK35_PHAAN|nr:hypothetical protein LR48_Vigan05g064500 [Vigna angularis]